MPAGRRGVASNYCTIFIKCQYLLSKLHSYICTLTAHCTYLSAINWNICVANFYVINLRVKRNFIEADGQQKLFLNAEVSTSACGSIILEAKTSSSMEEHERACILGYHEYKLLTVLLTRPLCMIAFSIALFCRAITCVGRPVDNDPSGSGRPPFGLK